VVPLEIRVLLNTFLLCLVDTSSSEENRKLVEQNRAPIIVSPRKVAAALANAIACFGEQNPSVTPLPSTPPVKSVIVRAGPGPTTSNVRRSCCYSFKINHESYLQSVAIFI
jgi:hypothetical protein